MTLDLPPGLVEAMLVSRLVLEVCGAAALVTLVTMWVADDLSL